jgi:regulator of protease activity HflC (stomatin/prohibitin superfamily)
MLRIEGIEIPGKHKGKGKGQAVDKLSEAREKSQGDLFEALDSLVQDIEGGLGLAAKIAGGAPAEEQGTVTDLRKADGTMAVADDS